MVHTSKSLHEGIEILKGERERTGRGGRATRRDDSRRIIDSRVPRCLLSKFASCEPHHARMKVVRLSLLCGDARVHSRGSFAEFVTFDRAEESSRFCCKEARKLRVSCVNRGFAGSKRGISKMRLVADNWHCMQHRTNE